MIGCLLESLTDLGRSLKILQRYSPAGQLIVLGLFLFQDGTDSIICSSFKNGSTLVGHYAVKGHQTPVRTTQVRLYPFWVVIIKRQLLHSHVLDSQNNRKPAKMCALPVTIIFVILMEGCHELKSATGGFYQHLRQK